MHSKLNPSKAFRRMVCPGSRKLEEQYATHSESPSAWEGKSAHWLASELLKRTDTIPPLPTGYPEITKEMRESAHEFVNAVFSVLNIGSLSELNIEKPVDISNVHPESWGIPDAWIIIDNHLHIFDFKYGHGFVDVYENWQLLEYAAGIAQTHQFDHVTMTVVQPRSYHRNGPVRSWTITLDKLIEYIARLQVSENLAMSDNAPCNPSPACTHCVARTACQALQQTALKIVDVSTENTPFELNAHQTGHELRFLYHAQKLLEARITSLEEQAKSMLFRGERVTGFKMDSTRGREYWNKTVDEIIVLGDFLGFDLRKSTEIITPVQARKLGVPDEVIESYAERSPGNLKLVADHEASRIFGSI